MRSNPGRRACSRRRGTLNELAWNLFAAELDPFSELPDKPGFDELDCIFNSPAKPENGRKIPTAMIAVVSARTGAVAQLRCFSMSPTGSWTLIGTDRIRRRVEGLSSRLRSGLGELDCVSVPDRVPDR